MSLCGIYVRISVEREGTSIEQQRELGIKFCEKQDFQYKIYEDAGSGFKIDDNNPFKNLPMLKALIDDIEDKVINKVWIWEHSRFARHDYLGYVLRRTIKKNKVIFYVDGKVFDLDDEMSLMIDGILNHVSRYERGLITKRTTRGLRKTINTGLRTYNKIYGYKNAGKQQNGYIKWEPVQSEIENIKYSFKKYLSGNSVDSIIRDLNNDIPEDKRVLIHKNYINVLKRFDYTGFSLTTEGSELYKKFKNFEIENLDFLKEQENGKPKYYLPSVNYSVKIVSIEDWITVVKKLRENKLVYKNKRRRTDTEVFTGIINCPYCNLYYYFSNNANRYEYYTHFPSKKCLQRPKSVTREKVNSLIEVFYFYYHMVYEDTNEFLKDNRAIANLNHSKIKDKISAVQSENRKIEKQINNFQNLYEEEITDKEFVKLTLKKENELNLKLENNNSIIVKLQSELSQLDAEFKGSLKLLTYEKVKELIIRFFEELSVEDKRAALIKIIKKCALYKNYLLIQAEKLLFIFNVKEDYILSEETYNEFKNNKKFKDNFLNSSTLFNQDGDIQKFLNTPKSELETYSKAQINEVIMKALDIENQMIDWYLVRFLGDLRIMEYRLKTPSDEKAIKEKLMLKEIDYGLGEINNIICFTEL